MLPYVVLVGAVINLTLTSVYIRDTIRGQTKPNRVTWLLWSLGPLIATGAGLTAGVTWAVLPVFISGFAPALVFLASFANKDAYWKLKMHDYVCGAFSVLALVLWYLTDNPIVAIALAIVADGLAALPTVVKAWKFPETETGVAYAGGFVNGISSFFAMKTFSFAEMAFPAYLVAVCTTLLFSVYRKGLRSFLLKNY